MLTATFRYRFDVVSFSSGSQIISINYRPIKATLALKDYKKKRKKKNTQRKWLQRPLLLFACNYGGGGARRGGGGVLTWIRPSEGDVVVVNGAAEGR